MLTNTTSGADYVGRKEDYCKVNVISQEEFYSQRREEEQRHEVLEDDLQFSLDDGAEESKHAKAPPTPQTKPEIKTSPDTSDGSAPRHLPWLEKRARFYPAPILPDKSDRKVRECMCFC